MSRERHPLRVLLLLVALSLVVRCEARANMSAPIQPGTALGEPSAALAGLAIEHERLVIDLRPLASDPSSDEATDAFGHALVSAIYAVRNDSAERPLVLEFLAESADREQWGVWLDGRSISATFSEPAPGDLALVTATTPGFDGRPISYEARRTGLIRFAMQLAPGRHTIRVEYVALATRHRLDHPLWHWQLAYSLAPARAWPSFGRLDVVVLAPDEWSVAADPGLRRSGDTLRGSFEGIPADALAITARARYEWWYLVVMWLPSFVVFALLATAAYRAGRGYGRRLASSHRSAVWAIPASIGAAFVLMVATPAAGMLGALVEESLVGAGQLAGGDYAFVFVQALLAIVAFVVGFGLTQSGAVVSIRRLRRRYDARWIESYERRNEPPIVVHRNGDTHHHSS